jgi:predicted ATP-dependent endonuclease of OLD family
MIKAYRLTNFKAFAQTPSLPIRPLTLIYGQNSSGKSSIIQPLLLLKQTLDESDDPSTALVPKGNLVALGGFREFLHKHMQAESFSIALTLPAPYFYQHTVRSPENEPSPDLTISFSFKGDKPREDVAVTRLEVSVGDDKALVSYEGQRRAVAQANTAAQEGFRCFTPVSILQSAIHGTSWVSSPHTDWLAAELGMALELLCSPDTLTPRAGH